VTGLTQAVSSRSCIAAFPALCNIAYPNSCSFKTGLSPTHGTHILPKMSSTNEVSYFHASHLFRPRGLPLRRGHG